MSSAHTRKKQPERVRRSLLDCAARLAAEQGLANLTVQAVAKAAGVTKGGLFHHFPSRQALVEAMFKDLLDRLDAEIDGHLAQDGEAHGCFTRAYVEMTFAERNHDLTNPWNALSLSMVVEPALTPFWTAWLSDRLERHRATDGDPIHEVVRLATDGAWLMLTMRTAHALEADIPALHARLIALTRAVKVPSPPRGEG